MPQPRKQTTAGQPPQPPVGTTAAAAVAPYVSGSIAPTLAAAGAAALEGAALTQAVQTLIGAFDKLASSRFIDDSDHTLQELRQLYPQRTPSELEKLVAQERSFEREYRRKLIDRLNRDLPEALRIADEQKRKDRLKEIFDREARFAKARGEAMLLRAIGKAEVITLKKISPEGAYWKLSPFVKQHTLDCLAMGEKFWPWAVIDDFQPPVHHGCACSLISLDDAVAAGLMTRDQVPDTDDALRRAKQALEDAQSMEEAIDQDTIRGYIESPVIEEAGNVHRLPGHHVALRWAKGFEHGGQFRPSRGGDPGRALRALFPHPKSPLTLRGERRGRWTWINGRHTRIPEADHWEKRVAKHHYVSPPGSTNVYKDGKLLDGMGMVSPERHVRSRSAAPVSPQHITKAAKGLRDGMRQDALGEMSRSTVRPPVKDGDGPSSLLALRNAGFTLTHAGQASSGTALTFHDRKSDTKVEATFDGSKVSDVRWTPVSPPAPTGVELGVPPRTFEEHRQDAFAWARELADRHGAQAHLTDLTVDPDLSDHAGWRRWTGEAQLGALVPGDIERAGDSRFNGVPLSDDEKRGVWSSYWVTAHEIAHSVNPIDPVDYDGVNAAVEEALTEEMAHVLARERLTEQEQDDVLKWRKEHPDAQAVLGTYRSERAQLGKLLDEAGIADEFDRRKLIEELKFRTPPVERTTKLADLISAKTGQDFFDALTHVEDTMLAAGRPGAALPFKPKSPGHSLVGNVGYGRFAGATLTANGKELHLPNGQRRVVEKLPIMDPALEPLTDGTALTVYPKGHVNTAGLRYQDGSLKNFRYIDTESRAKDILRAFTGKGSPGVGMASPGTEDDGIFGQWWKKLTHSGGGDLHPAEQSMLDEFMASAVSKDSKPKGKAWVDPMVGKKIGGNAEAGPPTGPIPAYDATQLELGKSAGGSNGARFAFDEKGDRWLVKTYRGNRDRVATEVLANSIYRQLGAPTPVAGTMETPGDGPNFKKIPDTDIGEPPLPKAKKGMKVSTGLIVAEPDGRLWIYEPKDHFGGYEHSFPKGRLEHGLTGQQNAHKELFEETGLHAHITGFLGDYDGTTTTTRFYLAVRTGGDPEGHDAKETAAVKLVTPAEAKKMLNGDRDQKVLADAIKMGLPKGEFPDQFPEDKPNLALVYPTLDGEVRERFKPSEEVGKHYMADALLGNWDFVGMTGDNILWDGDKPIRLDQGGTLEFRAQGSSKPFGPVPTEVWTMLSKGQGARGVKITEDQMREQAASIAAKLTPARINKLVDAAPFADESMRERVRENLKARRLWMKHFADGKVDLPRPAEGDAAHEALFKAQEKVQLYPEQEDALYGFMEGLSGEVNDVLRDSKKKESKPVKKAIDELDSIMRHAQTDTDIIGYVPINLGGKPGDDMEGKTLQERGFTGLFLSRPDDAEAVLKITLPEGSHALYTGLWNNSVEPFPEGSPDVLVARDAKLRVTRVDDVDGQRVISATMATQKPWKPLPPMKPKGKGGYQGGSVKKDGSIPSFLRDMIKNGLDEYAAGQLYTNEIKTLLASKDKSVTPEIRRTLEEEMAKRIKEALLEEALGNTGCMVALYPTPEVQRQLAVPGGEPMDEIHLTLAFLGEAIDIDQDKLLDVVAGFAPTCPPIEGEVSGTGQFIAGPKPVTYASADLPNLPDQRERLVEALIGAGLPVSREHGFTPHMTLAYDDRDVQLVPIPLTFDAITVKLGDDRHDFPLTGEEM